MGAEDPAAMPDPGAGGAGLQTQTHRSDNGCG